MGNKGSKVTFLRPAYYGDSERNFRVFEASTTWGKEQDRTAGNERERDRVRYPSFQNRDAHALRFGSMNPISRIQAMPAWGKALELDSRLVCSRKVNIRILTDEIDMGPARARKECGRELA